MADGIPGGRNRGLHDSAGSRAIPIVVGLLCVIWAIAGAVWGCSIPADRTYDQEQTICALALVCGLYMVLTGLWFATRQAPTWKCFMGLAVMLLGVQWGTWTGIYILARNQDGHFASAHTVFFAGLLIHVLGVLYVRKE